MMKFTTFLPLVALLCASHAASSANRPSVSDNARRITTLEDNQLIIRKDVDVNIQELTDLESRIQANTDAINAIRPIPGPPGKAGPLSDLQCAVGEVAVWSGAAWICGQQAQAPAPQDETCISGFFFTLAAERRAGPDEKWRVLCEREFNVIEVKSSLTGSWQGDQFVYDPESLLSKNLSEVQFEFPLDGDFAEGLVAVYPARISDMDNPGQPGIKITLVAHAFEVSRIVGNWAMTPNAAATEFGIIENYSGMSLEFDQCTPESFSALPKRNRDEMYLLQTLTIHCTQMTDVHLAEHSLMALGLAQAFDDAPRDVDERLDLTFEVVNDVELAPFNRNYDGYRILELQLPSFIRGVTLRDLPRWHAGPISMLINAYSNDDLPR